MTIEANHKTGLYKLLIILQCLIWGVGNPITTYVYISMTPFCYMAVRFMSAFLLFCLLFWKQIRADLQWTKIKNCTVIGLFMAATYIFANLALAQAMVTVAGFLMGISVVFTALFSVIFLKGKMSLRLAGILAVVLVGMYLLCGGGSGNFAFGLGEFYALMSSVCMAVTLMMSAKYIKEVSPFTLSAIQCGVCGIANILFGLIFEDFSCILHAEPVSWAAMLYLVLGCTVATFIMQNVSINHLSPIFVSLAFCTEPLFTAIASFLMIGDRISLTGWIGCALITLGVAAASILNLHEDAPPSNPLPEDRIY